MRNSSVICTGSRFSKYRCTSSSWKNYVATDKKLVDLFSKLQMVADIRSMFIGFDLRSLVIEHSRCNFVVMDYRATS